MRDLLIFCIAVSTSIRPGPLLADFSLKNDRSSICDNSNFRNECLKFANNKKGFFVFKRSPIIIDALQHVNERQGKTLLKLINKEYPGVLERIANEVNYHLLGYPITYDYSGFGNYCPTYLRYVKISAEIERHFGSLSSNKVIEIGGGYGGQCAISSLVNDFKEYVLIDLPEVLELAKRYINELEVENVSYISFFDLEERIESDFVISNYAFSECKRSVQDMYIRNVLLGSKGGYMIYNSFKFEEDGPYTVLDFSKILESNGYIVNIFDEVPCTGRGNKIVTWRLKSLLTGEGT